MVFEVILEIDPGRVANDATVGLVATQLLGLAGSLADWTSDFGALPAVAKFEFGTADEREGFLVCALAIPGVSIATRQEDVD